MIIAYQQTEIAAWGAAVSLLTLFAASGAALFAERAAHHTKRSADTADQQLFASENVNKAQLRAYLDFESLEYSEWPMLEGGKAGTRGFRITVKNYGVTPSLSGNRLFRYYIGSPHAVLAPVYEHRQPFEGIAPSDMAYLDDEVALDAGRWETVRQGFATLTLILSISYQDVFGDTHDISATFFTNGNEPIALQPGSKSNSSGGG